MEYFTPYLQFDLSRYPGGLCQDSPLSPLSAKFIHGRRSGGKHDVARTTITKSTTQRNLESALRSRTSFYTHSNLSGELNASKKRKNPNPKSVRHQRGRSDCNISYTKPNIVRPLVQSRMRLWKMSRLTISLHRILEEKEILADSEREQRNGKSWSSEPIHPHQISSAGRYLSYSISPERNEARSRPTFDWPVDPIPPCPLSVIDEGSDSSSSEEDLNDYQFDLSSCAPLDLHVDPDHVGFELRHRSIPSDTNTQYTRSKATIRQPSGQTRKQSLKKPKAAKRVDLEVDISSVYASIMHESGCVRPEWM